jgi:hypothetical protein
MSAKVHAPESLISKSLHGHDWRALTVRRQFHTSCVTSFTEEQLAVLRAIGPEGATEQRIAGDDIDNVILAELVRLGGVWIDTITLHETQPSNLARQASPGIRVYYLTPSGADAIGVDPRLIGGG